MYVQGKGGRISAELLPGAARGPGRNGPPPPRRGHDAFSTLLDPQCLDLAPLPAAGAGRGRARRFYRWFLCAVSLLSLVAATKWLWSSSSRGGQRAGDAAGVYLRGPGPAAAAAAAGAGEPKRRVAVCFFGLTRSLRWTLPSLQRRLLGALEEAGMEVDVFVHTFSLEEVRVRAFSFSSQESPADVSKPPSAPAFCVISTPKEERSQRSKMCVGRHERSSPYAGLVRACLAVGYVASMF